MERTEKSDPIVIGMIPQINVEQLRTEVVALRGGNAEELDRKKRRSTFVFDKGTDRNELMKMLSVSDLKDWTKQT